MKVVSKASRLLGLLLYRVGVVLLSLYFLGNLSAYGTFFAGAHNCFWLHFWLQLGKKCNVRLGPLLTSFLTIDVFLLFPLLLHLLAEFLMLRPVLL